jgi:hypothetical protein
VEYCLNLEQKLSDLQDRYNIVMELLALKQG